MSDMLLIIWRETRAKFRALNWWCLILFGVVGVIIGICEVNEGRLYTPYRGWWYIAALLLLLTAFTGPVCRIARERKDQGILPVVFWGVIGLLVVTIAFVACFSVFVPAVPAPTTGAPPPASSYERLLNVVPAVIAVWAAGLGWYIHHQITMKAHRTTHAFNLLMQTRTNAEFLRYMRAFTLVYPVGIAMPKDVVVMYRQYGIAKLPEHEAVLLDPARDHADKTRARDEIRKIEAVNSAKYLLNFYEFMARGINSGDLDSEILYDTIGSTVVGIFKRTAEFRIEMHGTQPLAMQFLSPLAEEWSKRKKVAEAELGDETEE